MKYKILLFSLLVFLVPAFVAAEDLEALCAQISSSTASCQNLSSADCRATLEKCAAYYDAQSAEIAKDLTKTAAQKNTLQNAVSGLKKKITSLEGQINKGTLMVKGLNLQINDTAVSINKTEVKIEDSQQQIIGILRAIYREDKKPSLVILLEGDLSDFFSNVAHLENLNAKVSDLLETNLKLTEAQYQAQQKEKATADKNASAIKARIFELVGVSNAPTFGQAVEIDKYVSGLTGVRPALLLAVLTQESSLGKNVGQCYVTDLATGSGTNLSGTAARQRVMNPKSIPTFITLTESLGMDYKKTPVSCWIPMYSGGVPYGWGGAMGPAQFIASTWSLYKEKVAQIIGMAANPWNIRNAFLASGLLLKDNGALTSESVAAAKYYCGGNYRRSECKTYANSVLRYAAQYEADIKAIGG